MKIQFLNGGLANQTFQYIFTRYYELSHPGQIMYLDDSYFALYTVHNGYELDKVYTGVKPHMLSACFEPDVWQYMLGQRSAGKSIPEILQENGMGVCMIAESDTYKRFNPFGGKIWETPVSAYHPEILDYEGFENVYFHGYWLNSEYFKSYRDVFLRELSFPPLPKGRNQAYLQRIRSENSVSLHVRRGDYVTEHMALDNALIADYARQFREQVSGCWTLFVFSDDIAWCRQHESELAFSLFDDIVYVEGNTGGSNYIDMQLMSQCRGMIMSNSSFCYLAALLNQNVQYVLNPTTWKIV